MVKPTNGQNTPWFVEYLSHVPIELNIPGSSHDYARYNCQLGVVVVHNCGQLYGQTNTPGQCQLSTSAESLCGGAWCVEGGAGYLFAPARGGYTGTITRPSTPGTIM